MIIIASSSDVNTMSQCYRHGADVNAVSDSGSTSVRSVCYIVRPGLDTRYLESIDLTRSDL